MPQQSLFRIAWLVLPAGMMLLSILAPRAVAEGFGGVCFDRSTDAWHFAAPPPPPPPEIPPEPPPSPRPQPSPSAVIPVAGRGSTVKSRPKLGTADVHACQFTTIDIGGNNTFGGTGGLSADGSTLVCFLDGGPNTPIHACTYTAAQGLTDLGALVPSRASTLSSFGYGVNANGSVVVGMADVDSTGIQHAFRWTAADGMVDLGSASGPVGYSRAMATNGDGSTVVGDSDFSSGQRRAFLWTDASGFQDLDPTGFGLATAISADGTTVVGQNRSRAYRWSKGGTMQDLPIPPGRLVTTATGVSDDSNVIVGLAAPRPLSFRGTLGWDFDTSDTRAVRWTPNGGMQDLTQLLAARGVDMSGVTLIAALGVSPDGQYVVGALTTADTEPNRTYGFIAQVCDEAVAICGP